MTRNIDRRGGRPARWDLVIEGMRFIKCGIVCQTINDARSLLRALRNFGQRGRCLKNGNGWLVWGDEWK